MKRKIAALVEYASSDDEKDSKPQLPAETSLQNPVMAKKRKLPPVSSSLVLPGPVDDPSLHQGRIRTTPHVDGQFAAHVYVSVGLSRRSHLYKTVQDILCDAKRNVPTLYEIVSTSADTQRADLHISLSRPIFLRAHQREDLKRAVKNIVKAHKAFTLSFAVLSELINDEKTRTFLAMEVGAGHHELHAISKALRPVLQSFRQQEYYDNPKFHTSIAWALLQRAGDRSPSSAGFSNSILTSNDSFEDPCALVAKPGARAVTTVGGHPTILQLPSEMIVALNSKYSQTLSSPKVGSFDVEAVSVKIGKDISSWKLVG
ncbi:hypothetical protein CPB83DRAFT_844374 [Crepidotus variabilis]|uniref:U6 snRNA phosphodiesterase 1 n=1 Tax=Crepidotus variabilis TaxID=179855 RepID=A0A9P6ESC7_9AGAR|nr:hypothetical protein CPB83DRAFT_844374 [Crepidotus variabilis]